MDVDKKIVDTGQQILNVLNGSGLTLGIMQLILKDMLYTVTAQLQEQIAKESEKEVVKDGDA